MHFQFDPVTVRDRLVDEISNFVQENGFHKVVVGISGGKDSTITAALCVRALGKENVFGVLLPDGTQADIGDSHRVCQALGIPHAVVNIGAVHRELCKAMKLANEHYCYGMNASIPNNQAAGINVPPRLRMTALRYITQARKALLAGTGNLSEITVGYCTKDGDTSCDFSVLGALTSVEVVQIGLTMEELPRDLVLKTPSDGLCGMSDEEKLGVSYDDIHHYIRHDKELDEETWQKIAIMEAKNTFKRHIPIPLCPFPREEL